MARSRIQDILSSLNPYSYLGIKKYSAVFPIIFTILIYAFIESVLAFFSIGRSDSGSVIIFVSIALVIYFSFRNGIRGGMATTILTVIYYFYILFSNDYPPDDFWNGVETTIALGILYSLISYVIGRLKERVDSLIIREADEKKRLQSIVDQLPVGVIITDSLGNIVEANKYVKMLHDKVSPRTGRGRTFPLRGNVHENRTEKGMPCIQLLSRSLELERSFPARDYEITGEAGRNHYLRVSSSIVRNNAGKLIAAVSIINDISQQKQLETRKDDFINIASHELKTPITSLLLYMEILARDAKRRGDRQLAKTVRNIYYISRKIEELVSGLLDVSRIQMGILKLKKEEFDLGKLVFETAQEFKVSDGHHRIRVEYQKPLVIAGDRFRIYQVLSNLLSNARKYSPDGGDIIVRVNRSAGKAVVSVADSGIGIEPEQQKKIFGKLYRVEDKDRKTVPGLGLGLYISADIIKRHRGRIWVESSPGKGATFYFSLPLK